MLVGGLRVLGANAGATEARRLHRPARDADQRLLREPARHGHRVAGVLAEHVYEGRDRDTGDVKWTGTAVDLVFGLELPAAGPRGGLRQRRRGAEVRGGLRRGLGQGDESRPLRPSLICACQAVLRRWPPMRKEPPSQPLNAMGGRSRRKSGCPSDVPSTPEGRLVAMILPVVRNVLPRLDTHVSKPMSRSGVRIMISGREPAAQSQLTCSVPFH